MTGPVVERFERAMAAELASTEEFTKWAATAKPKEAYESCYQNAALSPEGQKITAEFGASMEGKSCFRAATRRPDYAEMAALMGALGCARAVMLDGGLSSQLLVRGHDGEVHRWPGMRRVPLGLEIIARSND